MFQSLHYGQFSQEIFRRRRVFLHSFDRNVHRTLPLAAVHLTVLTLPKNPGELNLCAIDLPFIPCGG